MGKKIHPLIPVQKALKKLGANISHARRRRRIPMDIMAERVGFSRITLAKIEKGDPSVSMGSYASTLFALGLVNHLAEIADLVNDVVGRELEEENLPKRIRLPKSVREKSDE